MVRGEIKGMGDCERGEVEIDEIEEIEEEKEEEGEVEMEDEGRVIELRE